MALNPFIGLMGVAPAETGAHSTSPPRYCGGNIDCKELGRGSTLFLPISVEGALFSIGDGHAAQGDGEVSGTAIECPMDLVDITLTVRDDIKLSMPRAKTPAGWIAFGFNEDLNLAAAEALNGIVEWLQEMYKLGKAEALALSSAVVDLRVTQIVNGVKGVHAVLPHGRSDRKYSKGLLPNCGKQAFCYLIMIIIAFLFMYKRTGEFNCLLSIAFF